MWHLSGPSYRISCHSGGLPDLYQFYCKHAILVDEINLDQYEAICFFALQRDCDHSPFVVIAQSYGPAGYGFEPGALIIEETNLLFIGAGERLLAYDLSVPVRLWEDRVDCGFWFWSRHDDVVVMSAEVELAAWDINGQKLWTTFVEPPWSYQVEDDMIALNVMGDRTRFELRTGPVGVQRIEG